jgi:hypothetical protein
MAAAYNQIIIHYRDINGQECQSFWSSVDQTEGPASDYVELADKVQACTDAAVIAVQFQSTVLLEATPADGDYPTVMDRCMTLSRRTATTAPITLQLVAPKASIFEADTETLDLTNADIVALQALMVTLVGDTSGNPIGPWKKGVREMARGTP